MGELRAYVLPVRALRTLLLRTERRRELVTEIVLPVLAHTSRPAPLGPIFTRVPGAAVSAAQPTRDDLELLLAGGPVPPHRARATWRLVEAVASDLAAGATRVAAGPPGGLAPLGLAVPEDDDLVAGSWTLAEARAQPALRPWADGEAVQVPATSDAPDVVVFWSRGPTGGG